MPRIDPDRTWDVTPLGKVGDVVTSGTALASIKETSLVDHRIIVPAGLDGEITSILPAGFHKASSVVARIRDGRGRERSVSMVSRWPVRTPRPVSERLLPDEPLLTGQRVIDGLFPISKGGVAAIPGGFGTGKTVTQHQLAKWSDARIVVYIAGERGNDDPGAGGAPVLEDPGRASRSWSAPSSLRIRRICPWRQEASIYTGITIAEYYRDTTTWPHGRPTSRWAEALRDFRPPGEIPAEEGFRLISQPGSPFYEQAGRVITMGGDEGSITVIGAVSPGEDFTEPVTSTQSGSSALLALTIAGQGAALPGNQLDGLTASTATKSRTGTTLTCPAWACSGKGQGKSWRRTTKSSRLSASWGGRAARRPVDGFTASLLKTATFSRALGPDSYCPLKAIGILDTILAFHERRNGFSTGDAPVPPSENAGDGGA